MIFPWSATRRYIDHLEREIVWLRASLHQQGRAAPPKVAERRDEKPDPPPAKLVELCSRFEQQGPRILEECVQDRRQTGKPWEHYVREVEGYFQANGNGGAGG